MELGPGRALFARFAADTFDGMAELFDSRSRHASPGRAPRRDHPNPSSLRG
jgi:hypothetical protein